MSARGSKKRDLARRCARLQAEQKQKSRRSLGASSLALLSVSGIKRGKTQNGRASLPFCQSISASRRQSPCAYDGRMIRPRWDEVELTL